MGGKMYINPFMFNGEHNTRNQLSNNIFIEKNYFLRAFLLLVRVLIQGRHFIYIRIEPVDAANIE